MKSIRVNRAHRDRARAKAGTSQPVPSTTSTRQTASLREFAHSLARAFQSNNFDQFIQDFRTAPKRIQKSRRALLLLGHSYYELGSYQRAIEAYSSVLRRRPTDEGRRSAHYNRGLAFRELDKFRRALRDFRAAGANYEQGHSLIGEMSYLLARKRPEFMDALNHLRRWLRKSPEDGYSRYCLAACYNQLDNHRAALRNMLRCAEDGYVTEKVVEGIVTELGFVSRPREIRQRIRSLIPPELDRDGKLRKFAILTLKKQWPGSA